MTASVLVAYASRYGSTREVAEVIAATLHECGLEVETQPARETKSVDGHASVVLGAPFYMWRWHEDAQRFLTRHQEALEQRPVAVFALGPVGTDEERNREAPRQMDEALAKYPWLHPVAQQMFGGKYEPSKLSLSHKLLAALPASPLHGVPASDLRDWKAIRAWACDLAEKLRTTGEGKVEG